MMGFGNMMVWSGRRLVGNRSLCYAPSTDLLDWAHLRWCKIV